MELRYNYRIYPNSSQRTLLNRTFGCSRVVYNSALALKKDLYDRDKSTISDTELNRRVVTENPNSWIKEVAQIPLQQSLRALTGAFRSFFRKENSFPKFKKK
jgi:putative transposase